MQAYGSSFARVYNLQWTAFAKRAGPYIRAFYESTRPRQGEAQLLDLCCGTGQLALHFLDHGYQVTGLDLSEPMLEYARANCAAYIIAGQARFVCADAADFMLTDRFGLVVSTFDALNHLPDFDALEGCFRSAFRALDDGGMFLFDLNTLRGLQRWASVTVNDTPEMMLVVRSLFDEPQKKGFIHISGFLPARDGLYERFEETAYNCAFDLQAVEHSLRECGFSGVRFARLEDLSTPVNDPETEMRIFIIAEK